MLGATAFLAVVGPSAAVSLGGVRATSARRAASMRMAASLDDKSEPLKFVTLSNSAGDSAKVVLRSCTLILPNRPSIACLPRRSTCLVRASLPTSRMAWTR